MILRPLRRDEAYSAIAKSPCFAYLTQPHKAQTWPPLDGTILNIRASMRGPLAVSKFRSRTLQHSIMTSCLVRNVSKTGERKFGHVHDGITSTCVRMSNVSTEDCLNIEQCYGKPSTVPTRVEHIRRLTCIWSCIFLNGGVPHVAGDAKPWLDFLSEPTRSQKRAAKVWPLLSSRQSP